MTPTTYVVHANFVYGFFVPGTLDNLGLAVRDFIMTECGHLGCPVDCFIHESPVAGESGWVFLVPDAGFATKQGDIQDITPAELAVNPQRVEAFLARCRQVEGLPASEPTWLLCASFD